MNERGFSLTHACAARLFTLALLASATAAQAQTFEFVYGPPATAERGTRGVTPVSLCPGGGSIAVGTRGSGIATTVYVVRANAGGGPIWERTYDLAPFAGGDTGESLVQLSDGSGFVITGTTRAAATATRDAFLLKIDCNGNVVGAAAYQSPLDEGGFDIAEARSGDAAFGTKAGDLIVAGFAQNAAGGRNGLLFRTTSTGTLIWNRRYDLPGSSAFNGLIEARPQPPALAGDVVAVGQSGTPGALPRAYVVRVSGNHGFFAGAPHCAAQYFGWGSARFESVVELSVGPNSGELVMAGSTRSAAMANDVYIARSKANPCTVLAQRSVGDVAGALIGNEVAFDVRQVLSPLPLAPLGSLALTGMVSGTAAPGTDAFLLIANPVSLAPIPGADHLYGNHAGGTESGLSLAVLPTGFLIGGFSTTDFAGVGDPQDLYLVKPDGTGRTNCALGWGPPHVPLTLPPTPVGPSPIAFLQRVPRAVALTPLVSPFNACP